MPRLTYYKATRPDGTDFRTGTIDYAAALRTGEIIRHLLRDGGNGVPAAGPLIRILTDSEALAQYAKERGE